MNRLRWILPPLLAVALIWCVGVILNPRTGGAQINYKQGAGGGLELAVTSTFFNDALANTEPFFMGDGDAAALMPTFGWLYNGVGWDRAGYCSKFITLTQAASNTLQIVALQSGQKVRVCSFFINAAAVDTAALVYGTGSNCASGQVSLTGTMNIGANGTISANGGGPNGFVTVTAAAQELCLITGAGVGGTTGGLMYGQW